MPDTKLNCIFGTTPRTHLAQRAFEVDTGIGYYRLYRPGVDTDKRHQRQTSGRADFHALRAKSTSPAAKIYNWVTQTVSRQNLLRTNFDTGVATTTQLLELLIGN